MKHLVPGTAGPKRCSWGCQHCFIGSPCKNMWKIFIKRCLIFQQTKYSTQAPGGYLQPLPTPSAVWEDASMDFITGLPVSKGFMVILVVVDQFSKYAHFRTLPTSFNAHKFAELFMEIVVKHHGFPNTIMSDRDPIFVSQFWKQLFAFSGTTLKHSTTYQP